MRSARSQGVNRGGRASPARREGGFPEPAMLISPNAWRGAALACWQADPRLGGDACYQTAKWVSRRLPGTNPGFRFNLIRDPARGDKSRRESWVHRNALGHSREPPVKFPTEPGSRQSRSPSVLDCNMSSASVTVRQPPDENAIPPRPALHTF